MLMITASFKSIGVHRLVGSLNFYFFLKKWLPNFPELVSAACTTEVAICHVYLLAWLLWNEDNAVFNILVSVGGASEHMHCIKHIRALCFGELLDVLGVPSLER